jgi:hypothetical protein
MCKEHESYCLVAMTNDYRSSPEFAACASRLSGASRRGTSTMNNGRPFQLVVPLFAIIAIPRATTRNRDVPVVRCMPIADISLMILGCSLPLFQSKTSQFQTGNSIHHSPPVTGAVTEEWVLQIRNSLCVVEQLLGKKIRLFNRRLFKLQHVASLSGNPTNSLCRKHTLQHALQ